MWTQSGWRSDGQRFRLQISSAQHSTPAAAKTRREFPLYRREKVDFRCETSVNNRLLSDVMTLWLDLEASPVAGQLASAVLDLQGNLVQGELSIEIASLLFQILLEAGTLDLGHFRRITVSLSKSRFIISRDETHVYVVQTKAV